MVFVVRYDDGRVNTDRTVPAPMICVTLTLAAPIAHRVGLPQHGLDHIVGWLGSFAGVSVSTRESLVHIPDIGTILVSQHGETLELQLATTSGIAANFAKAWLTQRLTLLDDSRRGRGVVTRHWQRQTAQPLANQS